MKLSRNDRSQVVLGALIALVIFLAAVSPAHCRSTPLASCDDGNSNRPRIDLVYGVTKKGGSDIDAATRTAVFTAVRLEIIF